MEHEIATELSAELKRTVRSLDQSLDELATAATKITAGLASLADLAGRIRRMVDDPPAERHTLEIHDGDHEATSEILDGDTDPGSN